VLIAGGSGLVGIAATWWTLQSGVKDQTATAWGPNIAATAFALTIGVLAVEPIVDRAQERQEARRWGKQVRDLMLWVDVGIRIAARGMASLSDQFRGPDRTDLFSEHNKALQAKFNEYAEGVIGNLQTEIESVVPVLVMTGDGLDAYKLLHRVLREFKNPMASWRWEGTWVGVEETSDKWREWLNKQGLSDIPAELDRTHATTRETKREDQDDYLVWRTEEDSLGIARVRTPLEGGEPVEEARVGSEASALELLRSLPTGAGVAAVWDALKGWGQPLS
jgi:hypothetical protein